ncbi:MAG TPA: aminotransferase class V-fold PLP-dependent enzyme [Phycisphaerae bacterium]|nr:aminotransferase class V-fold PLP-dependent enzyme [Phycisphaerae bacterium]HOJ74349.1 aminotransferase class V-fold PLP-dependent enzyme [Phycisphaerae bacterium]HOM52973.1 aminotransferase class V-fold PLP-dependent enzyme [Phycisphaerae bacterium]HON65496.1 aminotransferase class V-fold PLP-dependent enzyme [Phycisphaerae bacterium]HOQ87935.1 aminotransferase class V-fold PLP-dependent enzyme [Phycisphaerae bacterium]
MDIQSVRELFPITRNYNFQNHAGVAPLCAPAAEAIQRYARETCECASVRTDFYREVEQVRRMAAQLINAMPEEITFVKNTTEGIGWVANGLSWNTGDNVVTTNVEFPANIYPWMGLQSRGVQLRMVPEENGRVPVERIIDAINSKTRVVTVSAVQFASGYRTDLATLGRVCKEKGVLFCVDAIQALGVLPIDVRAMNIDFLSADGHKWLCGPEGCGIFYCNSSLIGHLKPVIAGWLCMVDALDFGNYRFEFVDSARKFDTGSYNLGGIVGLGAAIKTLLDIGIENITAHVLMLTDRMVSKLRDKGYRVISSRRPGEASGIVAFISDVHDHAKIQKHLQAEHRIVIAVREGRLRSSPHVYNTIEEIDRMVEVLPGH